MMKMHAILAAGAAILAVGCAAAPAPVSAPSEGGQARASLALARKSWDRDVLEALRHFRKGAELRDAESCRQYLGHAETRSVNLSQRVYARLFVEGLLRKGPLLTAAGEDIRPDLYAQLAAAWRTTEPRSTSKAAQVEEAMRADVRYNGAQLYAGESADEMKRWLQ